MATKEELEAKIRRLESIIRALRQRFAPFLSPRFNENVNRKEAERLVAYWKKSLDVRRIWYDEKPFYTDNLETAYEMLAKVPIGDWIQCIEWFWRVKDGHKFWARVGVTNLSTLQKAHPEWCALVDAAQYQSHSDGDVDDFNIYK